MKFNVLLLFQIALTESVRAYERTKIDSSCLDLLIGKPTLYLWTTDIKRTHFEWNAYFSSFAPRFVETLHLYHGQWRTNTCAPCVTSSLNPIFSDSFKACDLFKLKRKLNETLGIVHNIMAEMAVEFPGATFDPLPVQEENVVAEPLGFTIRTTYSTLQHIKIAEEIISYLNHHQHLNINFGELDDNLKMSLCEVERILRSGSFHTDTVMPFSCLVGSTALRNCAHSYSLSINCVVNFLRETNIGLARIMKSINQLLVNF